MKGVYLTLISCAFILGAKAAERSKDVATPKRDGKGTTNIHSLYFKRSAKPKFLFIWLSKG